jgi:RNA polymerase sigma factor (sigma-70 family)
MSSSSSHLTPEVLARHAQWLRGLARAVVDGDAQADDLAQETWLRFASRPPGPGPLRPRLASILRSLSRNGWRADVRRLRRERAAAREEGLSSSGELAEGLELTQRLAREVARLPEHQRTVLLLRYFDGHGSAAIGRRLGLPASTVRARLRRGLRELRAQLEGRDGTGGSTLGALAAWVDRGRLGHLGPLITGATIVSLQMKLAAGIVVVVGLGAWGWLALERGPAAFLTQARHGNGAPVPEGLADVTIDSVATPGRMLEPRVAVSARDGAVPVAPFVARLFEAGSATPVPHYWIRVGADRGEGELVESDGEGLIRTDRAWAGGTLLIEALDYLDLEGQGGWTQQTLEQQHDPSQATGPARIEVLVGPTYPLDRELPGELAADEFRLTLTPTVHGMLISPASAPLRAGPLPWVRFGPATADLPGGGPWWLEAKSADGLWSGKTLVETNEGVYPTPVPLHLEPQGRLEVSLLGEPNRAPMEGRLKVRGPTYEGTYQGVGPFVLEHQPPGLYRLEFVDHLHEEAWTEVQVRAGQTTEVELPLRRRTDLLSLAGVLRSATGAPIDFEGTVVWVTAPSISVYLSARITEAGPRDEVSFRFEEVPPGEYDLKLSGSGVVRAVPAGHKVQGGDEAIVVPCEAPIKVRHDLEVRDDRTGQLIPFPLMVIHDGGGRTMCMGDAGRLSANSYDDGQVDWIVWAEGYAPWWSTAREHDPDRPVVVELSPGWGADFEFLGPEQAPVASVGLLLDGDRVGTSDAAGHLRVTRELRPERIDVASELWELDPAGDVKADGTYTKKYSRIRVKLRLRE